MNQLKEKKKESLKKKEKKITKNLIDNSGGNLLSNKNNKININIIPISKINYGKIKKIK